MIRTFLVVTLTLFAIGGLALLTAGCGSNSYHVKSINGNYDVVRIPYQARTVTCIRSHFDSGRSSWGGISCDWVAFHKGQ